MEVAANILGGFAIGAGTLFFVLVLAFWSWMRTWYRDWIPKIGVLAFRLMAAVAGVLRIAAGSTSEPGAAPSWLPLLIVAAIGYALWEGIGLIGDTRLKAEKEDQKKQIDDFVQAVEDAEADVERSGQLSSTIRDLANKKLQRVREAFRASELAKGSLAEVRLGLSPVQHGRSVLEHFAQHLRNAVRVAGGRLGQNFRVALYAEQDGYLQPVDAFDLKTQRHDPLSSYSEHRERFRLDNFDRPAHVVRCLQEGRMLIVEDCENAVAFDHFSPPQRVYLKSMIAYPLTNFSVDGTTVCKAVIALDTDEPGYFREDHAGLLETEIEEFAVRLSLEYAIAALLRDPLIDSQE